MNLRNSIDRRVLLVLLLFQRLTLMGSTIFRNNRRVCPFCLSLLPIAILILFGVWGEVGVKKKALNSGRPQPHQT